MEREVQQAGLVVDLQCDGWSELCGWSRRLFPPLFNKHSERLSSTLWILNRRYGGFAMLQ